ncbi:MAG: hypothetical protein Q8J98_11010 [Phaeovulum sp.]|uniref:hypothetical protein n=1 Tax=Phaeovulum sp. TaxID=2934796 RepID=UPI002730C538|nr:hypothetical protein [Phaeovulum sp.]MDP2063617.1 hypothetical protein [Phaeovulum sp.]
MFEKFRARRIMAKHTAFEVGIDRVLNASWRDVQRGSPDAEVKGFVAVFSFCIMNAFETLRIFGSQRVEVAKLLHGTVGDKTAVEIALLGIARASLDEDLSDDFTEVVAVAHMILTKVGGVMPYSSMPYEDFIDHFLPLSNLDVAEAVSVSATRISKSFTQMPEPMAGLLASSLAMSAASEGARYAEGAVKQLRQKINREE